MIRPKFNLRDAAKNYSSALAHMGKLSGLPREKIGRAEVGVILKTAAVRTKVSPVSELTKAGRLRTLRGMGLTSGKTERDGIRVTVNAGIKAPYGRTWARPKGGDKWQLVLGDNFSRINRHFSEEIFNTATAAAKEAKVKAREGVKKAKSTAGLARKGWIQIADSLNIDLANVQGGGNLTPSAIARARMAKAKGGKDRDNGASRVEISTQQYLVTIIYGVPYGRKLGLDRTLVLIIAGRVKFFATAVSKGYRGSLEDTAKLFPGWTVT